jgi:hypothetical protein
MEDGIAEYPVTGLWHLALLLPSLPCHWTVNAVDLARSLPALCGIFSLRRRLFSPSRFCHPPSQLHCDPSQQHTCTCRAFVSMTSIQNAANSLQL